MMKTRSLIITISAVILGVLIGLAVPLMLSPPSEPTRVDHEALKASLKKQFKDDLFKLVEEEVVELEKAIVAGTAVDKDVAAAKAKLEELKTVQAKAEQAELEAMAPQTALEAAQPEATQSAAPSTGAQVKDTSIQARINANRDKISDADLNAGSAIYNKLDTDTLFGLADGGLTPEENTQVQTTLRTNLSDSEYQIAMRLYNQYVGLLNAE